ncbi:DUF4838 domain-containing protein [bacterium]|nr:DUF4838 domain-containing protein [bacterium]
MKTIKCIVIIFLIISCWVRGEDLEIKKLKGIYIPVWAESREVFAANELAKYLNKMSKLKIPVRKGFKDIESPSIVIANISVSATSKSIPKELHSGFKYDGYRIKTVGNNLYIVSKESGGVVYGAYEYLRRFCGCSFLDYGERGETIPLRNNVKFSGIDVLDNPACWYRSVQAISGESEEPLVKRVDWMAKNGFSHLLVHVRSIEAFEKMRSWLIPALEKRGIKLAYGHHIFGILLGDRSRRDFDKFFEERPDFYPLLSDGKERCLTKMQLQWCMSNPDLTELVSQSVIEIAHNNPEADIISFWPNDGRAPACECESCKALVTEEDTKQTVWRKEGVSPEGKRGNRGKMRKYINMANTVAENLAEVYPQKKLSILAYIDVADPPVDVKLHPNIRVCLAVYWRCSKHTLTDSSCEINKQYVDVIKEWLKVIPPDNLYLYTYEMGMNAWRSLPWPVVNNLFEEWPWLKEAGLGGTHIQSFTKHIGVYGLNYLAVSHNLREDTVSFKEFVSDYTNKFFGPEAGPLMEQLIYRWEERTRGADKDHISPSPMLNLNQIFRDEDIEYCNTLCKEALSKTKDSQYQWRIERILSIMEFVTLYKKSVIFYNLNLKKQLEGEKRKEFEEWLKELDIFIEKHRELDDDIFRENFVPSLRRAFEDKK